jgi:hypothetical protein
MTGADLSPRRSPLGQTCFHPHIFRHNAGRRGFRHHLVHPNDDGHGKDSPKDEAGPDHSLCVQMPQNTPETDQMRAQPTAPPIRRLIGYARVSTEDQATDAQVDET